MGKLKRKCGLGSYVAFAFLQFQREAMLSFLRVVSEFRSATAQEGLDCELTVFPCLFWFGYFLFA
jgi:hypothetical protein